MKQTFKSALEYKQAINVKNLYKQLKRYRIGTTNTETLGRSICRTLPEHRQRTLVQTITTWKLQDAYNQLREKRCRNTENWRQQKNTIAAAWVINEI